ncbi:TetR family transcriptional regulator [Ralstonia pickettii DTP0602]|nr:TetR family transcriptional regulator [Ralstonia pickettii DTP0602]
MARSNRERTEATRQALLDAARTLFVSRGYGETSTPDVCAAAGITRGALYHHFADKRDLFRHVLAEEAAAVAADIEAATPDGQDPAEALIAGAQAYLDAMTVPGRTRLLLVEGPAALGLRETLALDEANAARTLREGLDTAGVGQRGDMAVRALAPLLSAAFDRAALEIEAGADAARVREAMLWLLRRVLGKG